MLTHTLLDLESLQHLALSSVTVLPAFSNFISSVLSIAHEEDEICGMNPEEPLIHFLSVEASEMLEDWTSDNEDTALDIKGMDEQVGYNYFPVSVISEEPPQWNFMSFQNIAPSSVKMLPVSSNSILSGLNIASEQDEICQMNPEGPLIHSFVVEAGETLEDWTSDNEDTDPNIEHTDGQLGFICFSDSIFDDELSQEQLDSMDFDLKSDDHITGLDPQVSVQNCPFVDSTYREAFKKLAESMKRSQETRASLKFKVPAKEAAKFWKERRESIGIVLSNIEISSMHIQQTYFHTIRPT